MSKRKSTELRSKADKKRRKKKKRGKRLAFLIVELVLLASLCAVAYGMMKLGKVKHTKLNIEKLEVYKDTGEYTNIALFGLDSREGELEGGVQSDCIMIASINNSTNEVKVLSLYRDTLLQQVNETYEKANSAYNTGGPEEAIALLNRNFDLDIKKYISVNFSALSDVVDELGGIKIDMTEEEVFWTNGYCEETSRVVGKETEELTGAGVHNLDGIQAVSYARIRYTEGNDFKRTERQRIVLEQIAKKAQKAGISTLNKIVDKVLPKISTNFENKELLGIAANVLNYKIGEMSGFPFHVTTCENVINHSGSYVVPIGLSSNVIELHQFLFNDDNYQVSSNVQAISDDITYLSGISAESTADMGVSYKTEAGQEIKGTQ